ncbi:nickel-responsive transcriptional regulator NikR [Methanospirillum sp. J.3.6.1-F.2.7.3]|jgi:CopG family nickel-responsive transcriptional regulator|uniref:Putative nickel-responsive regulator n=2 Tax=Methanospirillum TaxID=2202 RepID=A0A8E7AZC7_9EURY|nr:MULTISPECIES: nickel-responsive transcriptional regulator NikR [Methanospirillum]MDX8551245.1 nickel-responsive transcriptional regulator NikR [Methanospirillum hungatei]QVV88208.1 nickel-responsive transcriptional regulator NikR [Methanospirillum sp. J.3.6.1-F.2.7.3]QXO95691.1 nickel-responsive transcriptional regulator NikR [Methanospirillum hungatei]
MSQMYADTDLDDLQENDLSRIGVSLPSNLLNEFDKILNTRGYSSRSEGIRDAIRTYIRYHKWMAEVTGMRQGVITLVYDHHQRGLVAAITDIEHEFMGLIQASLHSHVSHTRCVEVLLVKGEAQDVKTVAERLMAQKGVETVKLTTIPLEG